MICIDVCLDKAGLLQSCHVSGHSGAGVRGEDIVCAAVSVLTRTTYKLLFERKGLKIRAKAPKRGEFWMQIDDFGIDENFLSVTGTFLLEGLKSISAEFPENVVIHIQKEPS